MTYCLPMCFCYIVHFLFSNYPYLIYSISVLSIPSVSISCLTFRTKWLWKQTFYIPWGRGKVCIYATYSCHTLLYVKQWDSVDLFVWFNFTLSSYLCNLNQAIFQSFMWCGILNLQFFWLSFLRSTFHNSTPAILFYSNSPIKNTKSS